MKTAEHPAIIRLSKAEQFLATAKDISDFKKVINIAASAVHYAKAAKLGEEVTSHAVEIKLKAQRGAGECLDKLEKNRGGDKKSKDYDKLLISPYRQALQDADVNNNAAKQYQQVAAVPQAKFNSYLSEAKEATTAGLLKEAKQEFKKEQKADVVKKIQAEPAPLPTGPFRVIVIDPPWKYGSRAEDPTHRARNPYPDMDLKDIKKLPVSKLSHDDCVLWLWTTNAFIREAFECLDSWGFSNKTILTWVKDRMGTGDWLRGKTEHCLMAVRGKPVVTLSNQTTALAGPMREHSRKPAEFYALVDSLCPGNKLEMFSRENRKGWEPWGGEKGAYGE